jgi:hypothetical protein
MYLQEPTLWATTAKHCVASISVAHRVRSYGLGQP